MHDVIGIGSLNTDFITTRERLLGLDPTLGPVCDYVLT